CTRPHRPPEHQQAEDRQVVPLLDLGQASRAARAGPDDALLPGDPVDADVQEAADDRADHDQAAAVHHVDLPEVIHESPLPAQASSTASATCSGVRPAVSTTAWA